MKELKDLKNVGKKTLEDLNILNIKTIDQLKKYNADQLYNKLNKLKGQKQDPCMWDIFASIINEAKTGKKTNWWDWSKIRKNNQSKSN